MFNINNSIYIYQYFVNIIHYIIIFDSEQKEEEELSKIASGIGKVFLQNVREREKIRQYRQTHLDPRNASRTPSAAREPNYRLRYQSPINACKYL